VVLSTVKAELMVFSKTMTQALWLLNYFDEVRLPVPRPLKIFADNSGSISNSLNNKNHQCTRYIGMWHHFIKEHTKLGNVIFQYTPTTENIANISIKAICYASLYTGWDSTQELQAYQSRRSVDID